MEILEVHKQMLFDLIEQGAHGSDLELLKDGDNYISKDELNNFLISACEQEHIFIIQMLVHLGANVNCIDNNRNTPLLISVQNNDMDLVQLLLTNKADVNASNSVGDSALILSINSSESTEITEKLLRQPGINIHHQNQDGYTAIMKAAEIRNINTLKLLLNEYFNLDNISTPSPLYVPVDECKTHDYTSNSVSEYSSQWTTLAETVNCKEENVYQIAKRSGIESVFQLLQKHVITKVSPLELAVRATDIKSFHVFLDSEFLYGPESEVSLDEIYLKIFLTCSNKDIIHFNENEIAMIKTLLEYGADVNITMFDYPPMFHRENTDNHRLCPTPASQLLYCERLIDPLLIAAKSGCVKVLELFLAFKANVNRYDFPSSPLHIALSHGHTDCAKLLVQHGANLDFKQALKLAVDQQEPTYVSFLTEIYHNGVKKQHFKRTEIQNILLSSVINGNLEIICNVLDLGANIDGVIGSNMCPLAESKNGEVAQFLIGRGADVKGIKYGSQKKSHTSLIKVLLNRDTSDNCVIEVIQVLLENGASANDRCWNEVTALMLAAIKEGSMSVIQLLLSHGAEIGESDSDGNTALIHSVCKGCFQNALFLLTFIKKGTELLNLQNNEGLTALMYAVRLRNPTVMKGLSDPSADVNIKGRHGNTLLLHQPAISEKYVHTLLKSLIQAGCDVNCQNNDGLSPLMVAAENCLKSVMCILLDSGADINAVSKINVTKTALTYLPYRSQCDIDYFSCLEYLLDRGASSSYLAATTLHKIIVADKMHIIPQLMRCGLGPVSVLADELLLVNQIDNVTLPLSDVADITAKCSPLCTALCVGNSALARFFVENLFLTHSDVPLLGHNKLLRQHLEKLKFKECLEILKELSTQPMTLFNLSFVAMSTSVGATPGREIRVNNLPVPQVIKDKLLFKKLDVALSVPQKDITDVILIISRI